MKRSTLLEKNREKKHYECEKVDITKDHLHHLQREHEAEVRRQDHLAQIREQVSNDSKMNFF